MAIIEEMELGKVQVVVNNNTGAKVEFGDVVFLNGFVGTVADHDGIENGADGNICINAERLVRSDQVEAGQAFASKALCYFDPTSKTIWPASAVGRVPLGYVEDFSDDEFVTFKPQYQNGEVAAAV